jgi:multidrug efflux pump subunit AcrB
MSFARFFIERPVLSIVLSILAVIAGLFTLHGLPIAQYPDITPPTVQVSTSYPGADPQLVATTVGAPIEAAINGVEGMLYMSSKSTQGSYALTITFAVGTDVDMATIHVQNKLNTVTSTLPESVQEQGITVQKASTDILVIFSLLSEKDATYDDLFLANYATLNLVDPLARVDGVGEVQLFGSGKYSIRVWMDPEVLRIRRVSAADVYQAIAAQNLQSTAGAVGQAPISVPVAFEYTLTVAGELTSAAQFADIIVRSTETGEYLRLGDIAQIELGSQSYATSSSYTGAPCALLAISQTPGGRRRRATYGRIGHLLSGRHQLRRGAQHDRVYPRLHPRGRRHVRRDLAVGDVGHPALPPELESGSHPGGHHPRVAHRHVHPDGPLGLLAESAHPVRTHLGHRHRGGRRHCRRRERRPHPRRGVACRP